MRQVVRLNHEQIEEYCRIAAFAFPEFGLIPPEPRAKYTQHMCEQQDLDEHITMLGLMEDDVMLGGYRVHDFTLNYFGGRARATGIGLVAVDLAHKKRKVARDMLQHFIVTSRDRGALFAMLYPFRPDFYHRMGFGWSSRIHEYAVSPLQLPAAPQCTPAQFVGEEDIDALGACYMKNFEQHHGMVSTDGWEWKRFLRAGNIVVGVKEGDTFTGFMSLLFRNVEGDNNFKDMHINFIVWNDTNAMHSLLYFIRTQADQVRHVHLPLIDDTFCYLLPDPRHAELRTITPVYHQCSRAGIGLMARVLDNSAAILARPWGAVNATVRFEVADDFLEGNGEPVTVHFENSIPNIVQDVAPDYTLACSVNDFSALLLNAVTLPQLHALGLIHLPQGGLAELTTLFRRDERPVCLARF